MNAHRKLDCWLEAIALIILIYRLSRSFPKDETYGLRSQIRRAAVSVATNIAEGYARFGPAESAHGLSVAIGSLAEVDTLTAVAEAEGYFDAAAVAAIEKQRAKVSKPLFGLQKKMRARADAQK